jgi:Kef-type K+ transport system membrane component KefB
MTPLALSDFSFDGFALLDLAIGLLILAAFAIERAMARHPVPPLVGFILLGLALRGADSQWGVLTGQSLVVLEFLGSLGLMMLLFRVGLESDLHSLVEKLPKAIPIWAGNVLVSGLAGYVAAFYVLDAGLVPSLFIATALTATSAAVAADIWRDCGRLKDPDGALMLDVVELDDVSGVILMMALLAVAPAVLEGANGSLPDLLTRITALFLLKAILFGAVCLFLGRYGETYIHKILSHTSPSSSILIVIGTGIFVAAVGEVLGFSVAVGAFFAGLIFSRDPDVVRMETTFLPLQALFAPFFFIGIGLSVELDALSAGLTAGAVLIAAAVIGKVAGGAIPALWTAGSVSALTLGISLVPRAEIALVIMEQGVSLGPEAVPPDLYAGMVITILATCFAVPIILRQRLMKKSTSSVD